MVNSHSWHRQRQQMGRNEPWSEVISKRPLSKPVQFQWPPKSTVELRDSFTAYTDDVLKWPRRSSSSSPYWWSACHHCDWCNWQYCWTIDWRIARRRSPVLFCRTRKEADAERMVREIRIILFTVSIKPVISILHGTTKRVCKFRRLLLDRYLERTFDQEWTSSLSYPDGKRYRTDTWPSIDHPMSFRVEQGHRDDSLRQRVLLESQKVERV